MSTFAERLLRAAEHAGVVDSQAGIARALNVSRQTANNWFTGDNFPKQGQLFHIARRFGVDVQWLREGIGEMLPPPGKGTLTEDESDLLRNYRSATPKVKEVIRTMARAVRKSVVAVSLAIPPLLSQPSDAVAMSKGVSAYYVKCLGWLAAFIVRWRTGSARISQFAVA